MNSKRVTWFVDSFENIQTKHDEREQEGQTNLEKSVSFKCIR